MTGILCQWDGEAFVPISAVWGRRADASYVAGQEYMVEGNEPRSMASHNQYFAAVTEAWKNLPEETADRFPTVDHLRKWCLIKAGYRDERTVACSSKAEAQRIAAFIKPMDSFAVVVVHEATVTVYTAKSQSMKAMGKQDFQESKAKVLEILAGMIGTTSAALQDNAGRAA